MELRRQIAVLRSWLWLLIVSALLAAAAAYLVSVNLPKVYEGKVTLIVGQSTQATNPDLNQLLASQRLSQTYAELATTGPLIEKVIQKNGLAVTVDDFKERITADAPRDSILIHLAVEDSDPVRAATLANSLAREMIAASPAIAGRDSQVQKFIDEDLASIQLQIEATQDEIQRLSAVQSRSASDEQRLQALQGRIVTLRQTYATMLSFSSNSGANLLTVVDPASPPSQPASPRILLNTLIAAIVGLLGALGFVFLLEHLDDTVKSSEDVEELTGLSTLGMIERMRGGKERAEIYRLATLMSHLGPVAEAYRSLRTSIDFAAVDAPVRTLLVTTAANLGVVFAQAGRRTIVLDADFRKPGVHRIFDLPNDRGLSDLLRSDATSLEDVTQATEQEHLLVITTGPLPPNPAELLGSHRMRTILSRISGSASLVIIDSPPLQAVTDAVLLSSFTDGTLLVVDAARTHRNAVRSGREALAQAGARVLGVALNRLKERSGGTYRYDYYGQYGPRHDGPRDSTPSVRHADKA
jgi:succinoglycan biosynthesis transport protein ExoP